MSDLTNHEENTCIYCGEIIDDSNVCTCQGRRNAFLTDLKQVIGFGNEPKPNDNISVSEMVTLREETDGQPFSLAYAAYKLGLIRGKRSLQRRSAAGEGRCVL